MPLHDPLDDDQPEPGAARVRARPLAAPEELGEELALLLGAHPDPRVVDDDLDRAVGRPGTDAHLAGRRVLDRVRHEVPEHLDQAVAVAEDRWQRGQLLAEGQPVARGVDPERGGHLPEHGREVHQILAELDPSGLDLGDVEEVVDQRAQAVGALVRHLEEAPLELGHRPGVAVQDELDVPPEGGQGRPELVRDRGHEFVLHPLDRLAVGHVPHDHDERAASVGGHRADRQLGGEPRAVLPHALELGPRGRPRRGGAGQLEAGQDDRDRPPGERGGGVAEQRLCRGIGRGDQSAPVGRDDPVLGGVDDPPELARHLDQILGAQARGIPDARQRRHQASVPDGERGEAGQPAERLHVDVAGPPSARPGDHELAHHLVLGDDGEADLPRGGLPGARPRPGRWPRVRRGRGLARRRSRRHARSRTRDRPPPAPVPRPQCGPAPVRRRSRPPARGSRRPGPRSPGGPGRGRRSPAEWVAPGSLLRRGSARVAPSDPRSSGRASAPRRRRRATGGQGEF